MTICPHEANPSVDHRRRCDCDGCKEWRDLRGLEHPVMAFRPRARPQAVMRMVSEGAPGALGPLARGVFAKPHIMLDLETLGTGPGCTVLSIGAVAFTIDGCGSQFYKVVDRQSCRDAGLTEDPSTLQWWGKPSEEARRVLAEASSGPEMLGRVAGMGKRGVPLWRALDAFADFVDSCGGGVVQVWGNGADFDNAILGFCYRAAGRPLPWQFRNNRCYRTLRALTGNRKVHRHGTHHNALDDANTQAAEAIRMLHALGLVI